MTQKVLKKKYYKISFVLASPLALGSGDNENTDKDLMKDSNGNPYIPASSIAGVVRESLEKRGGTKVSEYLGTVDKETTDTKESRILFYDATISAGIPRISVRDSVALDKWKTAVKHAKFDMEILEPGVSFTTYLEQDFVPSADEDYGIEIVKELLSGSLIFGGKSMRGYGAIKDVKAWERTFTFPEDTEKWISFDLYHGDQEWDPCAVEEKALSKELRISLRLKGGISIRRYTTKVSSEDAVEPDMEQLTVGEELIPVIPGTSWAGAIRHRMEEFGVGTKGEHSIFGYVQGEGKNGKARSQISFGESELRGGSFMTISRNAIDRFTGGTVDGALFTERTYYGGTTELVIGWKSDSAIPEAEAKALAAALADLHFGFLAVGGETSIGRGIFEITGINGTALSEEESKDGGVVYGKLLSKIEEVLK